MWHLTFIVFSCLYAFSNALPENIDRSAGLACEGGRVTELSAMERFLDFLVENGVNMELATVLPLDEEEPSKGDGNWGVVLVAFRRRMGGVCPGTNGCKRALGLALK